MKKIIVVLALLVSIGKLYAQQDVQFTHYMYNTLAVNPAYAGSRGMLNASLLGRQQWVGMDGAPSSKTFFVHSPIASENMGLGFSVVSDKVGPIRQTGLVANYSYTLKINENGHKLAMGISGSVNQLNANLSALKVNDQTDPAFQNTQKTAPNFGAGLYYHTDKWYTGVSSPKLLQTAIESNNKTNISQMVRHYYFLAGYVITLSDKFKLKPATMIKVTKNAPLTVDISAEVFHQDKLSAGLMYRLNDSMGALIGYNFTNTFKAGLSYDYTLTKLTNYNSGTMEIFLSYDFQFKDQHRISSPRYF